MTPMLRISILGDGSNTGTSIGRQKCFEYIWTHLPDTEYISEIHPDMVFPSGWEDPLINFLDEHDEPLICCGIIDRNGSMPFLQKIVPQFEKAKRNETFLNGLRSDEIVHGFTVPCIHVSKILKETGGYNPVFLKGKQCFEDDSMLLGYYYYYGTRANWYPKVCYRSVVYHAVAGQRISVTDDISVNLNGLFRQYGALGFLHLAGLHKSAWHQKFFTGQYNRFSSQ